MSDTRLPSATVLSAARQAAVICGAKGARAAAVLGLWVGAIAIVAAQPAAISVPPLSKAVAIGDTVGLTVIATGAEPMAFQWSHNGRPLPGATTASLSFVASSLRDAGWYRVVATNAEGSTAANCRLSVAPAGAAVAAWGSNGDGQLNVPVPLTSVLAVSAGTNHSLALKADGTVIAWGRSSGGRTAVPAGLADVVAIAANDEQSVALKRDGTVVSWGALTSPIAAMPANLRNVVAIAAGGATTIAVKSDGSVVSWGGDHGQLTLPANLANVVQVAVGWGHALALKADGTVVGWGADWNGQATVPAGLSSITDVSAFSSLSLALRSDGTVAAWGYEAEKVPANLAGVLKAEAAGIALLVDGATTAWQSWAIAPAGLPPIAGISAGGGHVLGLVVPVPVTFALSPRAEDVAPGEYVNLEARVAGTGPFAYQWLKDGVAVATGTTLTGKNIAFTLASAQTSDTGNYSVTVANAAGTATSTPVRLTVATPPTLTPLGYSQLVAPGTTLTIGVTEGSGQSVTYRWQRNGQVIAGATAPTLTLANVTFADAGWYHLNARNAAGGVGTYRMRLQVAPLAADRRVVAWGSNFFGESQVPVGLRPAVGITAQGGQSLILHADGTVSAWGYDGFGTLGLSASLSQVVALAGGNDDFALRANGTVAMFGGRYDAAPVPAGLRDIVDVAIRWNERIFLRADGTVARFYPVQAPVDLPPELDSVMAIAAGGSHALALKTDGTVTAWGSNDQGQCTVPANLTDVVAIVAGNFHSLALRRDGTVVSWGKSLPGDSAALSGLHDVIAISAGSDSSFALTATGRVVAWGNNYGSVVNDAGPLRNAAAISVGGWQGLAIASPPTVSITTQPQDCPVFAGGTASFTVAATGDGPLTYAWQKNGETLTDGGRVTGAASPTLSIAAVEVTDAATYRVSVASTVATVLSSDAALSLKPANDDLATAQTITGEHGTATGTNEFATRESAEPAHATDSTLQATVWYRWTPARPGWATIRLTAAAFGAEGIAVYTGSNYANLNRLTAAQANSGAHASVTFAVTAGTSYAIVVGGIGGYGSLTGGFTLAHDLEAAAEIVTQPASRTASVGANVTLAVTASGDNLSYQWFHDGEPVAGATAAALGLLNVRPLDAGVYTVQVTNRSGTRTSAAATLLGPNPPPQISAQPADLSVTVGQPATFTAAGSAVGTLSYQWRRNGVPIPGATTASHVIPNPRRTDADYYDVLLFDELSPTASRVARLEVAPASYPGWSVATSAAFQPEQPAIGLVYATARAPDGRFYAAGTFQTMDGRPRWNVARFQADGSVDPTFIPPRCDGRIEALLPRADGSLLVGGTFTTVDGEPRSMIVRLKPDGSLDLNFARQTAASAGVVALAPLAGGQILVGSQNSQQQVYVLTEDGTPVRALGSRLSQLLAVAPLPDGKILLAGVPSAASFTRVNPDGTLDATFAPTLSLSSGESVAALAVDADGRVLVGGTLNGGNSAGARRLLRMTADGVVVPGFAAADELGSVVSAVALQSTGKPVVSSSRWAIARLDPSGALDPAFTTTAVATIPNRHTFSVDSADRILVGAANQYGTVGLASFFCRLQPDGTTDRSFQAAPRFRASVAAVVAVAEGKMLVAGEFGYFGGRPAARLARVNADGTLDAGFDVGGGPNNTVQRMLPQADGTVVVLGSFTSWSGAARSCIVRLRPDGRVDDSFTAPTDILPDVANGAPAVNLPRGRLALGLGPDAQGRPSAGLRVLRRSGAIDTSFDLGGAGFAGGAVRSLDAQPDGKLIVAGNFTSLNGQACPRVIRLLPDGSRDVAFSADVSAEATINATVLLPDGRLLAGGTIYNTAGYLVRLHADGSRDSSFSAPAMDTPIDRLLRQEDGRVFVCGSSAGTSPLALTWIRLEADGALDRSFQMAGQQERLGGLVLSDNGALGYGNAGGATATAIYGLMVSAAGVGPAATISPAVRAAAIGADVEFVPEVAGTKPLTYQWNFNGTVIEGATNSSLQLSNVGLAQAGVYTLTVANPFGVATSNPVTLTGTNPPPVISGQPIASAVATGDTVTLNVTASGPGPLAYQWRKNGVPIAGATGASLTFTATGFSVSGAYDVLISDGLSFAVSQSAMITVSTPNRSQVAAADPAFAPAFEFGGGYIGGFLRLASGKTLAFGSFSRLTDVLGCNIVRLNANGAVDTTFSAPWIDGTIYAAVEQTDGRVVVGGTFTTVAGVARWGLARLEANGALDPTFAPADNYAYTYALALQADQRVIAGGAFAGGICRLSATGERDAAFAAAPNNSVFALAVQSDGRIVAGGAFTSVNGVARRYIARLLADGVVDDTYTSGAGFNNFVYALARVSGDRIIAAGAFTTYEGSTANRIVRLLPTALPDSTFTTGSGFTSSVYALDVLPDGRMLAGGAFAVFNGVLRLAIARLQENGALDTTFTPLSFSYAVTAIAGLGDGSVTVGGGFSTLAGQVRRNYAQLTADGTALRAGGNAPGLLSPGQVTRLLTTPDGKLVAAGDFTFVNGFPGSGVARFNANGSLDASFNPGGSGPDDRITDALQLADGRLLLVGDFTNYNGTNSAGAVRLAADGAIDGTWSAGARFSGTPKHVTALPDGGFAVVGGTFNANSTFVRHGLAVFTADGSLNLAFRSGSGPAGGTADAVAAQRDGRILVGGSFVHYGVSSATEGQPYLVRLLRSGDMDTSFAVVVDGPVTAMMRMSDGTILVGGDFRTVNGVARPRLARLTQDGALDLTFNPDFDLSGAPTLLVPQPDGSALIAGLLVAAGRGREVRTIFRLRADGGLDSTFAVPGLVGIPADAATLEDGSLVLAGMLQLGTVWRPGLIHTVSQSGPLIVAQPQNGTVAAGSVWSVNVAAAGGENVTYQWFRNGNAIAGATDASWSSGLAQAADSGSYQVRITHRGGTIDSTVATITVATTAPVAAAASANVAGFVGALKSGSRWPLLAPPLAAGTRPVAYQWTRDGAAIAGATNPTFFPESWQPSDTGEYRVTITNAVGGLSSAPFVQSVTPTLDWEWQAPRPQGNGLLEATFLNGRFLAGGYRGTILTSTDGQAWTTVRLGVANTVFAFAYGNGTFVALSGFSGLWSSTDGINWTARRTGAGEDGRHLAAIAFGSGRFVAVGDGGLIIASVDGLTWTPVTTNLTASLGAIAFGRDHFVALGREGRTYNSPNGLAWSAGAVLPRDVSHIAFGADHFVAGVHNLIFTSRDGTAWTERVLATNASITSLQTTGAGLLAAVDSTDGRFWQSLDATNWVERDMHLTPTAPLNAITYGANRYVVAASAPEVLLSSAISTSWQRTGQPPVMHFVATAAGDTAMVAVTSGRFWRIAADGTTSWSEMPIDALTNVRDVAFGGGMFVAVGGSGGGRITTSSNGTDWTSQVTALAADLYGVSYIVDRFYAVGANGLLVWNSGTTWNVRNIGVAQTLRKLAFGGGTYVAVGAAGAVFSSPDTGTWTARSSSGIFTTINDVVYGAGKFVLVSEGGSIRVSTDGATWVPQANPLGLALKSIVFAAGRFYAFAGSGASYLTSTDGVTWTVAQHGNANPTVDAVLFGSRLYLAGANTSVVSLSTNGVAPGLIAGPAAQTVVIGGAANLSVTVAGSGPFVYQWYKNGTAIVGANSATLTFSNVTLADAGAYTVVVTNAAGSVTSSPATLTIDPVRRGIMVGQATAAITPAVLAGAFTVEGANAKQMLIRAVGPALASFGVTSFVPEPRLTVVNAATGAEISANAGWDTAANSAQVANVAAQVGAFPLPAGSKDAAILAGFPPGTYRVSVTSAVAGVASLEIYDADTNPRIVYLATRALVDSAAFAQGFTILAPTAGRSYLVRALGPSLGGEGILADPQLTVFSGPTAVASNDDWGGAFGLSALGAAAGATPIAGYTKDAVLNFVPASAGVYSVRVTGPGGTSGLALVEIFEIDANRAGSLPLALISGPANMTVNAGQPASLGVVAVGKPLPQFQWSHDGVPITGALLSTLGIRRAQLADAGTYAVRLTSGAATPIDATATLTVVATNNGEHAVVERGYTAGGTVTVTNSLHYVGTPLALAWSVDLPAGWTYASDGGSAGEVKPAVGAGGTITWNWHTPPPSPVTFTYTLNVPAGETATRSLVATARVDGATMTVAPQPLAIGWAAPFHAADTDRNNRISLLELTRVIELYNTRNGSTRTGGYRVASTTEDGFIGEFTRPAAAVVALENYHSADSNRDGKLSLLELTRVIELYNYRSGTTRTGQYHVQAGTEDGFGGGP